MAGSCYTFGSEMLHLWQGDITPLAVRCYTFGSEMSQYEVDSKRRRYFESDIPETPVGVLIFGKNVKFLE